MISLRYSMNIAHASALCEELTALLGGDGPVTVDGGKVDAIDTSCLQLLLAFHRALCAQSRQLEWSGASAVLVRAATLLGIADEIGLERL